MMFFDSLLPSAISIATVFLFGCVGEIIMEKSGHLNLGVPGVMCFGTLGGCIGVSIVMNWYSSSPENASYFLLILIPIIFSALFSSIAGLIYGILTVSFRCNQNVTGLVLTTFGGGVADYFMSGVDSTYFSQASKIISSYPSWANNLGTFGKIFFAHSFLVYFAIILAIIVTIILKRTRIGLNLRSVGENPGAADAAGININAYKYGAILSGSIIAGLGGLFYVMDYVGGSWENSSTIQAFGWLSIALVIFTIWKPSLAIFGSILFGILFILPNKISGIDFTSMQAFKMIPYIVTIVVLIITSIVGKKGVQPPEALGLPYFREDR